MLHQQGGPRRAGGSESAKVSSVTSSARNVAAGSDSGIGVGHIGGGTAKDLADADEAAADVGFDRAERKAGRFGNLLVREALIDGESQDALLLGAKLFESGCSGGRVLGDLHGGLGGRLNGLGLIEFEGEFAEIGLTRSAAAAIDQPPSGDHGDERGFGGNSDIKAGGAAPDIKEDFLDGIFGIGLVKAESTGKRPHQAAVAVNTRLNRIPLTSGYTTENRILLRHSRATLLCGRLYRPGSKFKGMAGECRHCCAERSGA